MLTETTSSAEKKYQPLVPLKSLKAATYCVVIPVYNSEAVIAETLKRTEAALEMYGLDYEILAVNDGSKDRSWRIVEREAKRNPRIVAVNLVKNYGQHAALLCGLKHSRADFVITIDDDLQNPPEEIIRLIEKAHEGYDFVCGRFLEKKHSFVRRIGSRMVGLTNERVFGKPQDFALTNFRLMTRSLVNRICEYRTPFPYINGLAVSMAGHIANVDVEHADRMHGKSNYDFVRIMRLVSTILFSYSSFPFRLICMIGICVSVISFSIGLFLIARSFFYTSKVPGWTSLVVIISFYNGFLTLMLGMLGEIMMRVLGTTSDRQCYHVKEMLNYE